MIDVKKLAGWLEGRLPDFLDDARAMVDLDCGTANKAGVDAVGRVFRDRLAAAGCELTEYPLEEYGDCCLATWHGDGEARVFLCGHLDTVFPDGTAAARPMRIAGNHITGPGIADMKAGLLAGLYAIDALKHLGYRNFARIDFFVNTEEEVGSPMSQHLYRDIAEQADAALVLEGARANGAIVSARKGSGTYCLTAHGRQAHAGVEPERGANAIVELARCIAGLAELNGMDPGTTVNAGVIGGGTRANVVPDLAWVEVDIRYVTAAAGAALDRAIHQLAEHPIVPGTMVEVSGGIHNRPMEKTPASARLVEHAVRLAAELGFGLADVHTGGASDANYIAPLGVPTLDGLGPIGGRGHSPDEYLELDSIVPRTALLAGLIAALAGEA